ncbi:MAG: glycosyltransferase family 4 protein [Alphaproteobacteria bacterium]|nr:glycosyltransferase family 4 protein [Alphaproteobacteria bacterium]
MRILLVHNFYQQAGGEDAVFANEHALLAAHGHEVRKLTITNDAVRGAFRVLKTALVTPYSAAARRRMAASLAEHEPDLVHVHNFFPLFTPSIFDACLEAGVASVMTLHNYRLICPAATLYRSGHVCEECVTGSPYRAVLHGCYRGSQPGSLAVARMVKRHRAAGTWQTRPDRFIALTEFARQKFIEGGLPEDRIRVKPNFLPEGAPAAGGPPASRAGGLFVGRLSPEKGIHTLLRAWRDLGVSLRMAGDGPLLEEVRREAPSAVTVLGARPKESVAEEMQRAAFFVLPSEWYEGFPMVLLECFRAGLPVIASKLGAMAEIVEEGQNGLTFAAGNSGELAAKVRWAEANPEAMRAMGKNARKLYEANYTAEANYTRLMEIYEEARNTRHGQKESA